MIYTQLTDLIGHTPLLRISPSAGQQAEIVAKLECFNPGGSVKDRAALAMIEDAERCGRLRKGGTIIEPTSGNTGIGLAWVGRMKGYRVVLTMPDTMSIERRSLLKAYGAELVLTPGEQGMKGAIAKAEELLQHDSNAVMLGQFTNAANPVAHERTTGEEIWADTEGNIDIFVAGVGTGGTITGTARALKRHRSSIQVVAVEPQSSAVLSTSVAGTHRIQGIGAGFVPEIFDANVVDTVMTISDEAAMDGALQLAKRTALLAGISSGAAFMAAQQLANRAENKGKTIVVLLPDTGERYLSTGLFG